jgi:hypothetical protein
MATTLVVLAVHTAALVYGASSSATFVGDDIIDFWRASTLPLLDFVLTPNDLHFVPLHRIVARISFEMAPLDHRLGLGVLLGFHVATLVLVYRIATLLVRRSAAAFLVCVYGLHPCLGSLFLWWTSGLHRLGCICFVTAALYSYLRYREEGRRSFLIAVAACSLGAVGFYEKGLLIPVYMAALELSLLACEPEKRPQGKRWLAYLVTGVALCGYLIAWRRVTPPDFQGVNRDAGFLLSFVAEGVRHFAPTTFGLWLEPEWRTLILPAYFWIPPIAATLVLAPRTVVPWLGLLATLAANMAVLGASSRSRALGYALLLADRYYFENAFLVVPFAAIAVAAALESRRFEKIAARRGASVLGAGLAATALVLLALQANTTAQRIRTVLYVEPRAMNAYMTTLRATLADIPEKDRHPILLRDSPLPRAMIGIDHPTNHTAVLLTLLGEEVKLTRRPSYAVAPTGKIYQLGAVKEP